LRGKSSISVGKNEKEKRFHAVSKDIAVGRINLTREQIKTKEKNALYPPEGDEKKRNQT